MHIPCDSPVEANFLSDGLKVLKDGDWNYVFSGLKSNTPPQRFFSLGTSKQVEMLFPEFEITRTQDLEHYYSDAGQFYWGRKSAWDSGLPIFSSRSTILEIPSESAIDIDTLEDWHYAERFFDLKEGT